MSTAIDTASPSNPHSRSRLASTTLAEVMTINPITITKSVTPAEAFAAMRENGIRHLPVLEEGQLVGLLSQRDLYHKEALHGGRDGYCTVGGAMVRDTYVVAPGDCVGPVVQKMAERRYGCAIVVDRERVVGIFTATDALALLATMFVS